MENRGVDYQERQVGVKVVLYIDLEPRRQLQRNFFRYRYQKLLWSKSIEEKSLRSGKGDLEEYMY